MNAKCFFIERTERVKRYLRRYAIGKACPLVQGQYSYHDMMVDLDVVHESREHEDASRYREDWPLLCECGYHFEEGDTWQTLTRHLYRRVDTNEEMTLRDAPPGAMWYADWYPDGSWYRGPDGHFLVIRGFYGTDFCPDRRASNCTLPEDNNHKCWVRVGEVPNITIGKVGGPTCGAGAGSFFCGGGKWHGFVKQGELVQG